MIDEVHKAHLTNPGECACRPEPCIWKYDEDNDVWETRCDEMFSFFEGGPKENKMKYCPYCGHRIEVEDGK